MRRRWPHVVGALALAASTVAFLLGRAAEPQLAGAAALALPDVAAPGEQTAHHVRDDLAAPAPAPAPALRELAAGGERLAVPPPPSHSSKLTVVGDETSPADRTSKRRASTGASRASTRKAPTMPRRAAVRIDPDGTIDPYL